MYASYTSLVQFDSTRLDPTKLPRNLSIHPFIQTQTRSGAKESTYVALVDANRETGAFLSHRDGDIGRRLVGDGEVVG